MIFAAAPNVTTSSMDIYLSVFVVVVVPILTILWISKLPKKFPPGPRKLPFIGNRYLYPLGISSRKSVMFFGKKYGEVSGLYAFGVPCIFISGLEAIREGLSREDLNARPDNKIQQEKYGKTLGVSFSSGENWKTQRRFSAYHLSNLGKKSLEGKAHEELQALLGTIDEMSGGCREGCPNPVDISNAVAVSLGSVLWQILVGKRLDHNNPVVRRIIEAREELVAATCQKASGMMALLIKICPLLAVQFTKKSKTQTFKNFIQEGIACHKKDVDVNHPRDFVDIYLSEMEKQNEGMTDMFTEKQLFYVCADIFAAESGSVRFISFAFLYMILYPDVQEKVQREIDEVIGKGRLPSLNDRTKMPYTEATINEILRISTGTPATLPHSPLTNGDYVEFRGYHIPKDSVILFNIYGLHHDPKLWKSPEEFIPERFLPENENKIIPGSFIPFGAGRRACIGEAWARKSIFIFFTGVLQRYSLRVPDGHTMPTTKGRGMSGQVPLPYRVKVQLRS